nr:unnamed protein product [Callosobruchus chinensis]
MKQYNGILNQHNRLLDLVKSNMDCNVSRDYSPMIDENIYHLSLSISLSILCNKNDKININGAQKSYNFRRADFLLIIQYLNTY